MKKYAIYPAVALLISLLIYLCLPPSTITTSPLESPTPLLTEIEVNPPNVQRNDRSAITTDTSAVIIEVQDKEIITCPEIEVDSVELTSEQIETANVERELVDAVVFKELRSSGNDEEVLVSMLYDKSVTRRAKLDYLYQFHQEFPTHQIAYYHLLSTCLLLIDNSICNDALFENAATVDVENGVFWISIAALKFKMEDEEGALTALREAVSKSYYSEYFFESIILIEQSMSHKTAQSFDNGVVSAIGYTAATSINFGVAFERCLDAKSEVINVLDTCFQLGENMEQNSRSLILASLGASLVKEYYLKLHNSDAATAYEQKSSVKYKLSFDEHTLKASQLMSHDDELLRLWLQAGVEQGEFLALRQLTEEAEWRSQDPNYNPCKMQVAQ